MAHRLLYGIAGGLALAGSCQAQAQGSKAADSVAVATAVVAATKHYTRSARPESVLFDGPEYINHTAPGTIGHPFFLSAEPQTGTTTYRAAFFEGVALSYDLALDQVVMTYPNQAVTIALVPEQLAAFSLGSHQFVRVLGDSATGAVLPTGFYEVLQEGPVRLLAHHAKRIQQTVVQQNLQLKFEEIDKLFICTGRTAAEITSLKDVLASLPAHKAEAARYAHQQKLRFSAAQRAASALQVLRYYYTLPR